MAYRNKTFVSFDGDSDIHYYRLMKAWTQSDATRFGFHDAHDINTARDTSSEATIKRSLAERLSNSKTVVSLIGERTRYQYRFVRWELEAALRLRLPIVAVNLNGSRSEDLQRCPPVLRDALAVHVSFNAAIVQWALEHWPAEHSRLSAQGVSGPRFYGTAVYDRLGL